MIVETANWLNQPTEGNEFGNYLSMEMVSQKQWTPLPNLTSKEPFLTIVAFAV